MSWARPFSCPGFGLPPVACSAASTAFTPHLRQGQAMQGPLFVYETREVNTQPRVRNGNAGSGERVCNLMSVRSEIVAVEANVSSSTPAVAPLFACAAISARRRRQAVGPNQH